MQRELTGIQLSEWCEFQVQEQRAQVDNQQRHYTAQQSLQGAEIEKWSADEAIGCAYQPGHFYLFPLGEYLQSDGIESYRD